MGQIIPQQMKGWEPMETKPVIRTPQALPVSNMEEVGKLGMWLAKSGMFGCQNPHQGVVLAMACITTGRNPIELKEEYHLIDGNLSKRADAMLAALREHGGEYEIVSRTADKAEIKITCGKAKGSFSLAWDEAQREPFVWGKEDKQGNRKLKKNYATPRARMQMLWARVVSDGVRTCCPEAVKGSYAPEELQDMREPGAVPGGAIEIPPEDVEVSKPNEPKPEAKIEPPPPPESEPDEKPDFTRMPIGKLTGTHFKELSIVQLEQVIALDAEQHPQVTDKHKKNAANWLKKKQEAAQKPSE